MLFTAKEEKPKITEKGRVIPADLCKIDEYMHECVELELDGKITTAPFLELACRNEGFSMEIADETKPIYQKSLIETPSYIQGSSDSKALAIAIETHTSNCN